VVSTPAAADATTGPPRTRSTQPAPASRRQSKRSPTPRPRRPTRWRRPSVVMALQPGPLSRNRVRALRKHVATSNGQTSSGKRPSWPPPAPLGGGARAHRGVIAEEYLAAHNKHNDPNTRVKVPLRATRRWPNSYPRRRPRPVAPPTGSECRVSRPSEKPEIPRQAHHGAIAEAFAACNVWLRARERLLPGRPLPRPGRAHLDVLRRSARTYDNTNDRRHRWHAPTEATIGYIRNTPAM
jgi:hypothetical protein